MSDDPADPSTWCWPCQDYQGSSLVKTIDGIMLVDQVDHSRVQALGGKHMQYRFDDYARRYQ